MMFYEEIQIDGVWYWRNMPAGPWMEMGVATFTRKVANMQSQIARQSLEYVADMGSLTSQVDALKTALNPRKWDARLSDAWHQNIPDMYKAFEALREAVLPPADEGKHGI